MRLVLNVYWGRAVWIFVPNYLRFLFVGLDEERGLRNIYAYTKHIAGLLLDAAARTKRRKNQFRRTTPYLRARVAKCVQVDGGILEYLLWTVTNFVIPV